MAMARILDPNVTIATIVEAGAAHGLGLHPRVLIIMVLTE
jgi:hypothetical protein